MSADQIKSSIQSRQIVQKSINELTEYDRNANIHTPEQIGLIAKSMAAVGWTNPILINPSGMILAGHGRFQAAKQLGLETVPCIEIDVPPEKARAYILADNQLAKVAYWDHELLRSEIIELQTMNVEIETLGFEMPVLEKLLAENAKLPTGSEKIDIGSTTKFVHQCPKCGFEFN